MCSIGRGAREVGIFITEDALWPIEVIGFEIVWDICFHCILAFSFSLDHEKLGFLLLNMLHRPYK